MLIAELVSRVLNTGCLTWGVARIQNILKDGTACF